MEAAQQLPAWTNLINQFGFPIALLTVIGIFMWWFIKNMLAWIKPKVDAVIQAHVDRQKSASDSMKELVDQTVEIQKSNKEAIEKIPAMVERLLRTQPLPVTIADPHRPQTATVHVQPIPSPSK